MTKNNLLAKYQNLSPEIQREVNDFLEFILAKYGDKKVFKMKEWKGKIKKVSTWSDEDLQIFEDNNKLFSQWQARKW